ncbi:MAG: hypothetical protein Roseis2KO_03960 [Roseivirga sp.]
MVDSERKTYQIRQKGTFSVDLAPAEGFKLRFKVMGTSINSDDRKKKKKKARKRRKWKVKQPMKLLRKCMKALSIKALRLDIDTDDVALNAKLIPLAYFLSNESQNRIVNINFEGRLFIYLMAEIRLYLILLAFVKHLLKR